MNDMDGDSNDMFLANLKMKSNIIESLKSHAKGHIDKHKANVAVIKMIGEETNIKDAIAEVSKNS